VADQGGAVDSSEEQDFILRDESVRLCDLLKLAGMAGSGGQGKLLAASGAVTVDGVVETRKTAKIRAGQCVECGGRRVRVLAAPAAAA
jgi:ribosome-associated protein